MTVPYSFGTATSAIPLSQLDSNFNTPITLGNTAIQLGNTVTTLNNMTLANVTISSGNVTITNVTVTTANATTVNTTTLIATTANVTTGNVTNLISGNVSLTGGSITGTPISGSTGSFTTLTTSSTVTLNGGTANGVAYLNASNVLTTGSALTFDGTNFQAAGALRSAAATAQAQLISGSNVAGTTSFDLIQSGADAYVYNRANGPLLFGVNNSEQMRLTSTGLGIGTSSPSSAYSGAARVAMVAATGTNTASLRVSSANASAELYSAGSITEWGLYSTSNSPFVLTTNSNKTLTLDSSGNLGLEVTPSAWSQGRAIELFNPGYGIWNGSGSPASTYILANAYFNGGFKYGGTGQASHYYQYQGQHVWSTAASGTAGNAISFTQAMTLDASSRLLVGTTTIGLGSNGNTVLTLGNGTNNVYSSIKGSTVELYSAVNATEGYIGTFTNHPFLFYTNNTERARIDSGGDMVVGSSTSAGRFLSSSGNNDKILTGFSTITSGYTDAIVVSEFRAYAPNDATARFLYCGDTVNQRAVIRSNGGLANYQANDVNLSDRREKTNFAPAKSYLDTICAIPVQTFEYIDQSEDDPGLTLGVVAQDVQAVAPELVMESNWGTKDDPKMRLSIYQTDLQYALMKCIQELKAEVDSLKAQLKGA